MREKIEGKKTLKISIVTPSYNQSAFLPSTIESVLGQNYPNLEYIIIDGGSTDESIKIIKKYEQSLTYWTSEADNGQSDGINKGWRRVTGDIIGYLNSDDLFLPGALECVSNFFREHSDVDMIYGNALYIDETGKNIGRLNGHPYDLKRLLMRKITIPQPTMFFRKKLLDDIGYLDEDLHYTMDLDFWLRTALKHSIVYLHSDLAAMRMHHEAKTCNRQDLFYLDELKVLSKFFQQSDLSDNIKNSEKIVIARCYLRGADALFNIGQPMEARKVVKTGIRINPSVLLDIRILVLCISIATGYDLYQLGVRIKKKANDILKR